MPKLLNVDSSDPNKLIQHPTYKETLIVYCDKFQLDKKDEIYRQRIHYIQVVGLYDKATDTCFIEIVCFEHITYADPIVQDVVKGINNTIIPTESLAEFMTLIQLAYARAEQIRSDHKTEIS